MAKTTDGIMKNFVHKSKLIVYDPNKKIVHEKVYENESIMNSVIKKYDNKPEHYIISIAEHD